MTDPAGIIITKRTHLSGSVFTMLLLWSMLLLVVLGDVPAAERAALVDLYEDCGGRRWVHQEHWLEGDPCTNAWYGVRCDATNSTIVFLDPTSRTALNPLVCKIPPSLANLTNLEELYLSNDIFRSYLHGEIPSSLQNLKKLRCFYLSHGDLSGPIPAWIATLPVLQGLFLRHNSFSGQLPDLSGAKYIEDIWMDTQSPGGGLTSDDLSWMSKWAYLTHIHLENNNFTGALPSSLCDSQIKCHAEGNLWDCPLPVQNCCGVTSCGNPSALTKLSASSERRPSRPRRSSGSPIPYICDQKQ